MFSSTQEIFYEDVLYQKSAVQSIDAFFYKVRGPDKNNFLETLKIVMKDIYL